MLQHDLSCYKTVEDSSLGTELWLEAIPVDPGMTNSYQEVLLQSQGQGSGVPILMATGMWGYGQSLPLSGAQLPMSSGTGNPMGLPAQTPSREGYTDEKGEALGRCTRSQLRQN